MIFWKIIQRI